MDTQTTTHEPRKAYMILETERLIDGSYIVCIAVENEPGYYRTDWHWKTDYQTADYLATERNRRLGLTDIEAQRIVVSSMAAGRHR
jgi:hypothetical protein